MSIAGDPLIILTVGAQQSMRANGYVLPNHPREGVNCRLNLPAFLTSSHRPTELAVHVLTSNLMLLGANPHDMEHESSLMAEDDSEFIREVMFIMIVWTVVVVLAGIGLVLLRDPFAAVFAFAIAA